MNILFEDKHLIIINKEAGLMVEPDAYGHPNCCDQLRPGKEKEPFIQTVHRLDRPVSGILLFALKPSALKNLNRQFAERAVEKYYLAITTHQPVSPKGKLKHHFFKDTLQKKAVITDTPGKDTQLVELDYEITASADSLFLWKIRLHTGRYHQIRAQLAHVGCPVYGDLKYGSAQTYKPDAIALHARQLDFYHPHTNERMHMEAPAPKDKLWDLFGL
jgi:23S rRNA pseudouridine955/2504/2580 synthase/23S rRNA pseudouridine1911/1915/1917 synthase